MKFNLLIVFLFLTIFSSCRNCRNAEPTPITRLTEFEKSIIPYDKRENIEFIDQNKNIVIAISEPKEVKENVSYGAGDSCLDSAVYETISHILYFPSKDFTIQIDVSIVLEDYLHLSIYKTDTRESFILSCIGTAYFSNHEKVSSYSISGFKFQDVYIYLNCEDEFEISKIIYSTSKGIEFIEFKDGKYLKMK